MAAVLRMSLLEVRKNRGGRGSWFTVILWSYLKAKCEDFTETRVGTRTQHVQKSFDEPIPLPVTCLVLLSAL